MITKSIYIYGWYIASDGYPNVKWFLKCLENDRRFDVVYISKGRNNTPFSGIKDISLFRQCVVFFSSMACLCKELIKLKKAVKMKDPALIYIPYPSIFPMLLIGMFAKKLTSKIAIDSFISIYDTVVNDRKLIKKSSFIAKILFHIEKKTLLSCKCVIVDTECNKSYYEELFRIPEGLIHSLPLATDEVNYSRVNSASNNHPMCNVLFIGTLVPLHGIETIIKAVEMVSGDRKIRVKLIGDGQQGHLLEKKIHAGMRNVEWICEWKSPEELMQEIACSDICLGIFGESDKAKRVLPLKIYSYMQVGKPVITGECFCFPENVGEGYLPPYITVKNGDYKQLAAEIYRLANSEKLREEYGDRGKTFYDNYLSNKKKMDLFNAMVDSRF